MHTTTGAGVNEEFTDYLTAPAPRLHNQDLADYLTAGAQRYLHHHGQERENSMAMSEDGRRDTSSTILSGDGTDLDGVQVVAAVGPMRSVSNDTSASATSAAPTVRLISGVGLRYINSIKLDEEVRTNSGGGYSDAVAGDKSRSQAEVLANVAGFRKSYLMDERNQSQSSNYFRGFSSGDGGSGGGGGGNGNVVDSSPDMIGTGATDESATTSPTSSNYFRGFSHESSASPNNEAGGGAFDDTASVATNYMRGFASPGASDAIDRDLLRAGGPVAMSDAGAVQPVVSDGADDSSDAEDDFAAMPRGHRRSIDATLSPAQPRGPVLSPAARAISRKVDRDHAKKIEAERLQKELESIQQHQEHECRMQHEEQSRQQEHERQLQQSRVSKRLPQQSVAQTAAALKQRQRHSYLSAQVNVPTGSRNDGPATDAEIFEALDVDGDKEITMSEFTRMLSKHSDDDWPVCQKSREPPSYRRVCSRTIMGCVVSPSKGARAGGWGGVKLEGEPKQPISDLSMR